MAKEVKELVTEEGSNEHAYWFTYGVEQAVNKTLSALKTKARQGKPTGDFLVELTSIPDEILANAENPLFCRIAKSRSR